MKAMMKKIALTVLSLALVICMTACSSSVLIDPIEFNPDHEKNTLKSSTVLAENDKFQLQWDKDNLNVVLYDKAHDTKWSTTPDSALEKLHDENGNEIPATVNPKIITPAVVEYVDTEYYNLKTSSLYVESVKKGNYSYEKIDNGVRITYYSDKIGFSVPITYTLKDEGLAVGIDPTQITESSEARRNTDNTKDSRNFLYRIDLMPFFCRMPNISQESYLFYPSGTGALIYADNTADVSYTVSESVYGEDLSYSALENVLMTTNENVKMPVIGVKNGNKALIGIATKGAETTTVEADVGNNTLGYSSAYFSFSIRSRQTANKVAGSTMYSDQFTSEPMEVLYIPLYNDEANYTGMAESYRNYLIREKNLTAKSEQSSLSVSLIGGADVPVSVLGVPSTDIYAATTVRQAGEILTDLKNALGTPIVADLYGFGSSGVGIGKPGGNFKIAGNLGSVSDMKQLSELCKDNGIPLFMDYDIVKFSSNGSGISTNRGGSAKGPGHTYNRLYNYHLGDGSRYYSDYYYLTGREELAGLADKAFSANAKMGLTGVSFRNLTSRTYTDCIKNEYISKGRTEEQMSAIFDSAKESGQSVLGYSANVYATLKADYVVDAPVSSSEYNIFDEDVPFYGMVFKGYVPMYSRALNSMTTPGKAILMSVESGYNLRYNLTNQYSVDLLTVDYQGFNNTVYSDLKDDIVKTATEYQAYYNSIAGAKIVSHEFLTQDVRKVTYDNGITAIVNYGDTAYDSVLGTVSAGSYLYGKESAAQ